ncbi:MAG: Rieske 2Fe-2S domain-containing protein [Myxococcales bacterium]|nr:Rieske 2Fe-2S domain-containing protein [Myxococcales bacterium]
MSDAPWHDAAALDALPQSTPTLARVSDRRLALVRTDDGVFALDDACPHEGYPLSKGAVSGCTLTCCWHNFKFDLRDGACAKGEAVGTYPVRIREGRVEVQVAPPDPVALQKAAFASLEQAVIEGRDGQAARDIVRLLRAGAAPAEIAVAAARIDAERSEWGTTHILPVAFDVLGLVDRYPGERAVFPLVQPFELAAERMIRLPRRPEAPLIDPGPDSAKARERFLDAVEAEQLDEAEGLLRGALANGATRADLEPWFIEGCAAHFLDFGHALIYSTKAFDLLEAAGWHHAVEILPGLVARLVNATREEVLPEWSAWRKAMADYRPGFEAFWARQTDEAAEPDEAAVAALLDGTRDEALAAIATRLGEGVPVDALAGALVLAASERLLRFDVRIDGRDDVQDGWLDVTHPFTFAHAVRQALRRHRAPTTLALLFQAARFIQNAGALDDPPDRRRLIKPHIGSIEGIRTDILDHQADRAVDATAGYLRAGEPVGPLKALFEDLPIRDGHPVPIVVAHLIKTTAVAFAEHAELGRPEPLLALARLAASPIRQRWLARSCHNAIRFIVDGKVPRTLT